MSIHLAGAAIRASNTHAVSIRVVWYPLYAVRRFVVGQGISGAGTILAGERPLNRNSSTHALSDILGRLNSKLVLDISLDRATPSCTYRSGSVIFAAEERSPMFSSVNGRKGRACPRSKSEIRDVARYPRQIF